MSGGARVGAGLALGLGGGLGLAGTGLAAWVRRVDATDVAGVRLEQVEETFGLALAPLALPLGVAAVVLSFGLAVRHALVRRVVAGALLAVGLVALVHVGLGVAAGARLEGDLGPAAYAAPVAALAVLAAGALALRPSPPPPPALPPRYDLDAADEDAEWDAASVEDDEPGR